MTQKNSMARQFLRAGTAMSALMLIEAGFLAAPAYAQDANQTTQQPEEQPDAQATPPEETGSGPNPGTTAEQAPTTTAPTDDQATTADDETIVVTGTLLKRKTDSETPSPVTVMSAESLAQRGINTVAEAAQRVSANGAGTMTQGWNANGFNFATGANAISLRGLTVQSTLTVFDGLRMAPYPLGDDGARNFVDLNTIPNAIIDRIEVLRDGASSTYGADAVAGVINVITKRQVRGVHLNGTAGISSRGDAKEYRLDGTVGYGDLDDQGFNVYVSGEWQKQGVIWARDRGFPLNTEDWSRICNDDGSSCIRSTVRNDINANGTFVGLFATPVPTARAVSADGLNTPLGQFGLLNAAAGCGDLTPVTAPAGANANVAGTLQCQWDRVATQRQLQPEQERRGLSGRFTFNLGDRATVYLGGNFYNLRTDIRGLSQGFVNTTTPPGGVLYNPVLLPVYVCANGVGEPTALATGCNAQNGTLNPNNPFAAQGQLAQVILTMPLDRPVRTKSDSRSIRGVLGIDGSFGADWNYSASFTASQVTLDRTFRNNIIPRRLMEAVARGTFNFVNVEANTDEAFDYIAPVNRNRSTSNLWQAAGTLTKSLFELPGGPLQAAIGLSYRKESVDAPSANPPTSLTGDPFERYYGLNSVGATGSRTVKSGFFELSAPIVDQLELNVSGRYDKYSSGQKNFSPKFGAKFTPIRELAIRGTYSKGFRIPSFNEAFGLPTTGYIGFTLDPQDPAQAAFIAAHGGNAYATQPFPVGLTSAGNPNLDPEKSTGMTFGAIFEPMRNISFTVDFWRIKVKNLIASADAGPAFAAWFATNGAPNIPGVTVVAGAPDPQFPAALPLPAFIVSSYQNANHQTVSGIDFGANARVALGFGARLTSSLEASYLRKFDYAPEGAPVQHWAGTLSPCNVTSCSGAPKWRGSWQNTVDVGRATLTVTTYYTKGVDNAAVDFGGVPGDCVHSVGHAVVAFQNGEPFQCSSKDIWNVDLTGAFRMNDRITLYGNVLNLFDIDAPLDLDSTYSLLGYNPAFAGANAIGRFFRIGAKLDF